MAHGTEKLGKKRNWKKKRTSSFGQFSLKQALLRHGKTKQNGMSTHGFAWRQLLRPEFVYHIYEPTTTSAPDFLQQKQKQGVKQGNRDGTDVCLLTFSACLLMSL